jgi:anthranilate 1,2-dioxygenase small subunit
MKNPLAYSPARVAPRRAIELRAEIDAFHAEYCAALDAADIERWPGFFCEDATYRVTSRENALLGMPVGLMYCEGLDMIRDRAMAIAHSQMFAPRQMVHVLGITRVVDEDESTIAAQTPFMLVQTLVEGPSTLHLAGIYYDKFLRRADGLVLFHRDVVHDTEVLATALVYPV